MNYPPLVSRDEWLVARAELLTKEKEATHARDQLNAQRRRLPMVKIDTAYLFEGSNGTASLVDLFDGHRQLIIYHFMFDPSWNGSWRANGADANTHISGPVVPTVEGQSRKVNHPDDRHERPARHFFVSLYPHRPVLRLAAGERSSMVDPL